MQIKNKTIVLERAERLGGSVTPLPSKSAAHRIMIAEALSGQMPDCVAFSTDIKATKACVRELLFKTNITEPILPCGESGSTLRFLVPIAGALGVRTSFLMEGRLPKRPMGELRRVMEEHGCRFSMEGSNPLVVEGQLTAGRYELAGNVSSQYITGLLMALPLLSGDSELVLTTKLESRPYVDLTLEILKAFGIRVEEMEQGFLVPGNQQYQQVRVPYEADWSNAAVWLAMASLRDSEIAVCGLKKNSAQGDRAIIDLLKGFGAEGCEETDSQDPEKLVLRLRPGKLHGQEIDASDIPDLVPILALVAAVSEGTTHIYGTKRLRLKESDRLLSVLSTLNALGGEVSIHNDELWIKGNGEGRLRGGVVDSCNDHRIAMMAAVASQIAETSVTITDCLAVEKSYPGFYEVLGRLIIK